MFDLGTTVLTDTFICENSSIFQTPPPTQVDYVHMYIYIYIYIYMIFFIQTTQSLERPTHRAEPDISVNEKENEHALR